MNIKKILDDFTLIVKKVFVKKIVSNSIASNDDVSLYFDSIEKRGAQYEISIYVVIKDTSVVKNYEQIQTLIKNVSNTNYTIEIVKFLEKQINIVVKYSTLIN